MINASLIREIPEQGQLVEVRNRRYTVTDVRSHTLPHNPIVQGREKTQSLVSLASVEDDALGEELQVIWELEPGATIYEERALPYPDGFDTPETNAAFLDAVRWGAASSADVRNVQSPFRSGIDIEDYQLDPVVRAIQMPRVNLLIADDVGLGKTIEAGLVPQELILRQRVRRCLNEAHNAAPSGGGNYAVDSQRTATIRLLAPHFEHKLFLTATPHNGYPESFTALLELLDGQRFARGITPDKNQ